MEENFEPVARTRANYYTPGSPVQFVCVELLKGEVSGEHAVCLTFKNISRVTLTALEIHFKCKGVDGVILCEDEFEYRDLTAKPGESFGIGRCRFRHPEGHHQRGRYPAQCLQRQEGRPPREHQAGAPAGPPAA
mgnify:CR=1 FL=1